MEPSQCVLNTKRKCSIRPQTLTKARGLRFAEKESRTNSTTAKTLDASGVILPTSEIISKPMSSLACSPRGVLRYPRGTDGRLHTSFGPSLGTIQGRQGQTERLPYCLKRPVLLIIIGDSRNGGTSRMSPVSQGFPEQARINAKAPSVSPLRQRSPASRFMAVLAGKSSA